jgi:hypothetical protein
MSYGVAVIHVLMAAPCAIDRECAANIIGDIVISEDGEVKRFLQDYRFELSVVSLAVLIGIFLIFSELRRSVLGGLQGFLVRLLDLLLSYLEAVSGYLRSFSVLDLIGWLLILGAFAFGTGSIRGRYRANPAYDATVCPRCGSPIRRVHRTRFDRLLGKTLFPDSRRYLCANRDCGWSGLRHKRKRLESSIPEGEAF